MNLEKRIDALIKLGNHLLGKDEFLEAIMHRTQYHNPWFTIENQQMAIQAIANEMLQPGKLKSWISRYELREPVHPRVIGQVMAGNIPLVGFHDLLCVFVTGHKSRIKLSEKDPYILPYLLKLLESFEPGAGDYFEIVDVMKGFEGVIATGSNNSARYFEAYFGKYPHIIRKNRNAVAVLNGKESSEELLALGKDIFRYFGLGCRNVSKILVPQGYEFEPLLESLHEYRDMILHHKYKHNFDYNFALMMMNRTPFMNNGCIILTENPSIPSRIAMLHYEYYQDRTELPHRLESEQAEIQCVIAGEDIDGIDVIPFGKSQEPGLADYADGVDVIRFLSALS